MPPRNGVMQPGSPALDIYLWGLIKEIIFFPWTSVTWAKGVHWKHVFVNVIKGIQILLLFSLWASLTFVLPLCLVLFAPKIVTGSSAILLVRSLSVAWYLLCTQITVRRLYMSIRHRRKRRDPVVIRPSKNRSSASRESGQSLRSVNWVDGKPVSGTGTVVAHVRTDTPPSSEG
jgi:hypothetical protein